MMGEQTNKLSAQGVQFLEDLSQFWAQPDNSFRDLPERAAGLDTWMASGGRIAVELPDKFTTREKPASNPYQTQYVAKVAPAPEIGIYNEVKAWTALKDHEKLGQHLAPIIEWDDSYRWLVMRRVTVGHVEVEHDKLADEAEDLAQTIFDEGIEEVSKEFFDEALESSVQEDFRNNALGWRDLQIIFSKHGWDISDPDENTGYDRVDEVSCFFDYGGLVPFGYDPVEYTADFEQARENHEITGC